MPPASILMETFRKTGMGEPTDRPAYQVTPIGWVRVVDGWPHLDIKPMLAGE